MYNQYVGSNNGNEAALRVDLFFTCRLPSGLNSPNLFAPIHLFRFLHIKGFFNITIIVTI